MYNPLAQPMLDFLLFLQWVTDPIPLITLSLMFNMNFMSFYRSDLKKGGSVARNLRYIP